MICIDLLSSGRKKYPLDLSGSSLAGALITCLLE